MKRIPKQAYTPEFRELSVKRVKSGQSISAVAKDLGLIDQTLHNGVKAADVGKLNGAGGKPQRKRLRSFPGHAKPAPWLVAWQAMLAIKSSGFL